MTTYCKDVDVLSTLVNSKAFSVEEDADFEECHLVLDSGELRPDGKTRWVRDSNQATYRGVKLWSLAVRRAEFNVFGSGAVRHKDDELVVPADTKPNLDDIVDILK